MTQHAESKVKVRSWEEAPYRETDGGGKLTKATVIQALAGDLEGEGTTEFLMCYRPDGTATFIGQQEIVGTLGGRTGSFVVHARGVFEDGVARSEWSVVSGSGTGQLEGLQGGGSGVASSTAVSLTMDYDLE